MRINTKKLLFKKIVLNFFITIFLCQIPLKSFANSNPCVPFKNSSYKLATFSFISPPSETELDHNTLWIQNTPKTQSPIAIVAHGLNLKPSKMWILEKSLLEMGADVIHISLPGNNGSMIPKGKDPKQIWTNHFLETLCYSQEIAIQQNRDLIFIGYSLGSLIFSQVLNSYPDWEIQIKSSIHFSPAIAPKFYVPLVKFFYIFGNEFSLNSWTPKEYKARNGIQMKEYKAVFEFIKSVHLLDSQIFKKIPSLVLIDPNDELISKDNLSNWIRRNQLTEIWTIEDVSNSQSTLSDSYHHLIIDDKAVGAQEFDRIKSLIKNFIFK